ncbi:MAG: aminotransferase, partial [Chlorobiaceae bacterium]|nr:aminotransferase [Chlorobiaceae bacterium]
EIAGYYCDNIRHPGLFLPASGEISPIADDTSHVWHLFVIRSGERDSLLRHLEDNGVQALVHYPVPPHKQDAYRQWGALSLPLTESIHSEVLSLPISPVLDSDAVSSVCACMNRFGCQEGPNVKA